MIDKEQSKSLFKETLLSRPISVSFLLQGLMLAAVSMTAVFATGTEVEPVPPTGSTKVYKPWEETMIKDNERISAMFDGLADGIDNFLMGSKVQSDKPNETNVKIENTTIFSEHSEVQNVTDLNVNLRLPKVEEYWQLKFTTYDEQKENRGTRNAYLKQQKRERKPGAALGFFRKFNQVRVRFQPRVELSDPLKIAHSLAFETSLDQPKFKINPKLEFFADPDKGTGIFEALNFSFDLSERYSLTLINEGEYQERENTYSATNGFAIGHVLTEKSSLSYNLFFSSDNRPSYHLLSYNASISYNKLVYKNIFDYQIVPNVNFAKTDNFQPKAGLSFGFSINY